MMKTMIKLKIIVGLKVKMGILEQILTKGPLIASLLMLYFSQNPDNELKQLGNAKFNKLKASSG